MLISAVVTVLLPDFHISIQKKEMISKASILTKAILAFILLCLVSCATPKSVEVNTPEVTEATAPKAKNIILMVGDGMGLTQISAGTYAYGNTSNFERLRYVGIQKPYASNKLITDSAAGATAFSCGVKTYNGAIGVDADTMAVKTILEEAEEMGKSTGLIATSSITHATPASFIAHNKYRKNYEAIAADFLDTEVDFFVGGGLKYFSQRESDERNLVEELTTKGYIVSDFFNSELDEIKVDNSKNFAYFTANEEPLPHKQGRDYLGDAVKKSLNHLDSHGENGFFLMIEGSQIDWGGHANYLDYVLTEWKEFNDVIGDVLDWAETDGETLIIITADHETGGLAIQSESKMDSIVAAFTSDYHTGTMIPVFAHGPGAEMFSGIYENKDIYDKMREAFGFTTEK